jgi:hypothetical protein
MLFGVIGRENYFYKGENIHHYIPLFVLMVMGISTTIRHRGLLVLPVFL